MLKNIIVLFVLSLVMNAQTINIDLPEELKDRNKEYSGLDWYKDSLILLPQYAKFIYAIKKENLLKSIKNRTSLAYQEMKIDSSKIKKVNGFEGYESIQFVGDNVYLTIEAREFYSMKGYIVKGKVVNNKIVLDTLKELPIPFNLWNAGFEAMTLKNDKLLIFYEANGKNLTKNPYVYKVSLDLDIIEKVFIPNIEYRITDATSYDDNIVVINYFWPGEKNKYKVSRKKYLEQILVLDDNFNIKRTIPIDSTKKARNFEGLVRFNNGFLLVTDKFPESLLLYISEM